jgi:CubicO group peptidase (beta-lactamase class C family)
LYLNARDLARIFYLFLCNGRWETKQIIGEEWIRMSVTPSIAVPSSPVKYGLKWWLFPYEKDTTQYIWFGSGFGGQYPLVIPEHNIVAVFTGWNIIQGRPSLPGGLMFRRLLGAVIDKPRTHGK